MSGFKSEIWEKFEVFTHKSTTGYPELVTAIGITFLQPLLLSNSTFVPPRKRIYELSSFIIPSKTKNYLLSLISLLNFSTFSPTYLKETLCSGWLSGALMRNRDK